MIYSGSSFEFSDFRIHVDPDPTMLFKYIWKLLKKTTLNSIIKKNDDTRQASNAKNLSQSVFWNRSFYLEAVKKAVPAPVMPYGNI